VNALRNCFGADCLDRRKPIGEHRGENVDHLPISVVGAGELAPPQQRLTPEQKADSDAFRALL
jgi:hypothetical protein